MNYYSCLHSLYRPEPQQHLLIPSNIIQTAETVILKDNISAHNWQSYESYKFNNDGTCFDRDLILRGIIKFQLIAPWMPMIQVPYVFSPQIDAIRFNSSIADKSHFPVFEEDTTDHTKPYSKQTPINKQDFLSTNRLISVSYYHT